MLTPDHPNAVWLAEMYRGEKPDVAAGMSEEELNELRAGHVAQYMARMSPDFIIHTGGVRLAATGDMAFMKAYARRRSSLSDAGDVSIIAVNQILADDTYGIVHFQSRSTRGDHVWERTGMGAWRFENGVAVEHWELSNGPVWDAYYFAGDSDFNGNARDYWQKE